MPAPPTLNVTEQHQLLDALFCKDGTPAQFFRGVRNYTIAVLMLETGLRVGEVVQLRWSDLYFNGNPVTNLVVPSEIAKRKRERMIPVSTRLHQALEEYWERHNFDSIEYTNYFAFYEGLSTTHISTRQVERFIRAAAERSLGRPIHPHVLRHTFASKLMRVTDMRTVQELLGHKNISSTQVYTHPNEDDKKKAISKLDTAPASVTGVTQG